ncbi:MAG: hypothetical protein RE471_07075 [Ferroplasma sp.]|uniref:hypothetical protein n=1 Tax=Ferroplasma sp. TaxID=2591003 RepID=UPI002815F2F1|nr:hypothetical protein [Ferroplasma sp.]WMT50736.1 MAG: hypothetical protein RE471_07075 [Ferroplasma sp.]
MEFAEINRELTKYFELKIELNALPLAISGGLDLEAPCSITRDEDELFMTICIPKITGYEKLVPFFPLLGVDERQLYYTSRKKIVNESIADLIRKLDSITGLEIPYTKVEGKYLVLIGFMHESSTMAFSDLLSEYLPIKGVVAKVTLRPTSGFLDYMEDWCVNLKSIVISLPISVFGNYRVVKALKNTGAIGQFIDNYPNNGQFRLLIFANKDMKEFDGMEELSGDDHIYLTRTDEDILLFLANKAMKKNISWNFLFMYADDDKLYMNFILPDFRAKEYFNLIVDTEMDLKHLDWVTLEYYGDAVNKEPRNLLLDREYTKN